MNREADRLPLIIVLLQLAGIIDDSGIDAIMRKASANKAATIFDLILDAGYVNELELTRLQVLEFLICAGKLTLSTAVEEIKSAKGSSFEPGLDEYYPPGEPPEPQRIPRLPLPDRGTSGVALPLP